MGEHHTDQKRLAFAGGRARGGNALGSVADGEIGRNALLALVFVIGVGQALYAPTFTAVLPSLRASRRFAR